MTRLPRANDLRLEVTLFSSVDYAILRSVGGAGTAVYKTAKFAWLELDRTHRRWPAPPERRLANMPAYCGVE